MKIETSMTSQLGKNSRSYFQCVRVSCALCLCLCVVCIVSVSCVVCIVSVSLYRVYCVYLFVSCVVCLCLCVLCIVSVSLCLAYCVYVFVSCVVCLCFVSCVVCPSLCVLCLAYIIARKTTYDVYTLHSVGLTLRSSPRTTFCLLTTCEQAHYISPHELVASSMAGKSARKSQRRRRQSRDVKTGHATHLWDPDAAVGELGSDASWPSSACTAFPRLAPFHKTGTDFDGGN